MVLPPSLPQASAATATMAITDGGPGTAATATAQFSPAVSGQAVKLQAKTIVTSMTAEVTSSTWRTVATGTQDARGKASFSISNPLEVKHQYRAVTGAGSTEVVSSTVKYVAKTPFKKAGIPAVSLNTNEGKSINTRSRYFEGRFAIKAGTGCSAVSSQLAAAKGRGNSSWTFAKKSYTVKLDKKVDLCGMGASKKWALVANHYDKSLLRNSLAGFIGSKMTKLAWTPKSKPVDLYVNGSYRGSYLLIERIAVTDPAKKKPGEAVRVSVPELDSGSANKTGGYVLEWDFRKGADHNVTVGKHGYVGIKEPENDYDEAGKDTGKGITAAQIKYIDGYLDAADKALFGKNFKSSTKGWRKYIDQRSAVDYYIAMELMKPLDGNMFASVYMYKKANGKLYFGPLWDFDIAAGNANKAGRLDNTNTWYLRDPLKISTRQSADTWFNRLNDDPGFQKAVSKRWTQVHAALKKSDSYLAKQSKLISKSAAANFKKWNVKEKLRNYHIVKGSWSKEVSYLRSWTKSRISWMNGQYR
ncbi:CotH kinase family protein [Arthrobacter sp. NPDC089319]|uniref:CotH kinase family protein n=1 Tax=Arthrobacter sp. NPDC089319 TaxID=3155915 RepID=UPI003414AD3A